MNYSNKKRHRAASASVRQSSAGGVCEPYTFSDGNSSDSPQKITRISSFSSLTVPTTPSSNSPFLPPSISGGFNDPSTADVILRLYSQPSPFDSVIPDDTAPAEHQIYLHSSVLRRAKFFAAMLSDRWIKKENPDDSTDPLIRLSFGVSPTTGSIYAHAAVIRLLYTDDITNTIDSVTTALSILPIALELLFEDCIKQCVRFLESVPWSEDEEKQIIINIIPHLGSDESGELLARVSPPNSSSSEEMLYNLILMALHNHYNVAAIKAFVARQLRDFSSIDCTRRVLERAFSKSLNLVKESLEEYSSPDFRGGHSETEALQRLNLHAALSNGKHLLWILERMIELKVAGLAVEEWSESGSLASDLQKALREDACRNIVPGLPTVVLKCTYKLANAVAAGSILVPRQVRKKLVEGWLPVLIVCKDNASSIAVLHKPFLHSSKPLYLELEEAFLKIISTLPMEDSQELLQQCVSFSTRDPEDCPHLMFAFSTWFRRATRQAQPLDDS